MNDVPWVAVAVALLGGILGGSLIPSLIARRTARDPGAQEHLAKAAEGFAELVNALQLQIDRERRECVDRLARIDTERQDEIRRIRASYESRIARLSEAKHIIEEGLTDE